MEAFYLILWVLTASIVSNRALEFRTSGRLLDWICDAVQALSILDLLKRPREVCVGLGRNHGKDENDEEDDDEIGITIKEAGEGGTGAALMHQDL